MTGKIARDTVERVEAPGRRTSFEAVRAISLALPAHVANSAGARYFV